MAVELGYDEAEGWRRCGLGYGTSDRCDGRVWWVGCGFLKGFLHFHVHWCLVCLWVIVVIELLCL